MYSCTKLGACITKCTNGLLCSPTIVGVSANVISVTQHRRSAEHVRQFEMLAILKCVVIKPRIFSPVARQPALTWQAVCTQTVVRRLKCYHPSMKWMRSPRTALWHILAVYNMCPCDLDPLSIFTKIGSHDWDVMLNIPAHF